MLNLRVEPGSGVPLGTQIARQIRLLVAKGRVAPGERLPSARDLAAELCVNFHTVRKAYRELERDGVLESRRGQGTFVAGPRARFGSRQARALVREHLERLLEDLAGAGIPPAELAALVARELRALTGRTTGTEPNKERRR